MGSTQHETYAYSVSDVATALGLTPSALHFFERENLLVVKKNSQGHRIYSMADVYRILSYNKYRSIGFSLKTLVKQFDFDSAIERKIIMQRLEKAREEAAQKAAYYRSLTSAIDQHILSAASIDRLLDTYEFVQSPAIKFCYNDDYGWIPKKRHAQLQIQKWIKAMPMVRLGIIAHSLNPLEASFGFLVTPEQDEQLNLPQAPRFDDLPPLSCLHTIVTTGPEFQENPSIVFEKPFQYAHSRGFTVVGKPWAHIILCEIDGVTPLRPFVELWIPIS